MYHKTLPYRIFSIFNNVFLTILSLLCLLPLYHLLMVSLSASAPANAGLVTFWPIGLRLKHMPRRSIMPISCPPVGVRGADGAGNRACTHREYDCCLCALQGDTCVPRTQPLSVVFCCHDAVQRGLIPGYILILKLGLMNTLWALILPGLVAVFNIILLLNFFRTVPKDLEEAAFIDGAGHFQSFIKIYLPVSVPVIATVSLFMMVGHWNAYFDGIIYIRDSEKLPLATFMQTIIVQADMTKLDPEAIANLSQRTIRASQIFISALPILLVYPFLQRYFVTGLWWGCEGVRKY